MNRNNNNVEKTFFGISRGEMSLLVAIALGLIIGTLIKKVRIGIMVGLFIGLGIMFLNHIRKRR